MAAEASDREKGPVEAALNAACDEFLSATPRFRLLKYEKRRTNSNATFLLNFIASLFVRNSSNSSFGIARPKYLSEDFASDARPSQPAAASVLPARETATKQLIENRLSENVKSCDVCYGICSGLAQHSHFDDRTERGQSKLCARQRIGISWIAKPRTRRRNRRFRSVKGQRYPWLAADEQTLNKGNRLKSDIENSNVSPRRRSIGEIENGI